MAQYDIYVKTEIEDRIIVSQNSKWGLIDNEDKIIIPVEYDNIRLICEEKLLFIVSLGTSYAAKEGLISNDGTIILSPQYDSISLEGNICRLSQNNKHGLYNLANGKLIECKFDNIRIRTNGEQFFASINSLWGVFDISEQECLPIEYDNILCFSEGYICRKKKLWGVIDKSKNVVIDFIYTRIEERNNVFICNIGNKYGILKYNGEVIIPCEYANIINVCGGVYKFINKKKDKYGIVFVNEGILIEDKYDKVEYGDGYITARINNNVVVFNLKGNEIVTVKCDKIYVLSKDPILFGVCINKKHGIIKCDGTYLISPRYQYIDHFSNGYSIVSKDLNDNCGLIDQQGYEVIPTCYQSMKLIKDKYILVKRKDKFGLIEKNGKICLPIIYDYVYDISDNSAKVWLNDHEGTAYFRG